MTSYDALNAISATKMIFHSIVTSDYMVENSNGEINTDIPARQSWQTNGQ